MQEYNVRIAEFEDAQRVVDLVNWGVAELKYLGMKDVDADAILDVLAADIDESAVFLLCFNGIPVGLLAGVVSGHPVFRNDRAVTEMFWYVLPEHRVQKASTNLIDAYEFWARRIGAKFACMSHFHDKTGFRLKKVYDRRGYRPIEYTYIKELN